MKITDPHLARETTRVPRRSDYVKRPVLSATIHPDLQKDLGCDVRAHRHEY